MIVRLKGMRVLYAWELGDNAGHLSRASRIGERFRIAGNPFLSAVRNTNVANHFLTPERLHFVQAPIHMRPLSRPFRKPITSYAGILAASGYDESSDILGLLEAWISLIRLFGADVVLLDHAPTALLASRILRKRVIAIGSGFEIPPSGNVPALFWGGSASSDELAIEKQVTDNINKCLQEYNCSAVASVGELFEDIPSLLTTFPELDHYGARGPASYIGPLAGFSLRRSAEWGSIGTKKKVFVYLSGNSGLHGLVLRTLANAGVNTIAVFPHAEVSEGHHSGNIQVFHQPVDLKRILPSADAVITNGGAGLVAETLAQGIPMILIPTSAEQKMGSLRVQAVGAGLVLQAELTSAQLNEALSSVLREDGNVRYAAKAFSQKYRSVSPASAMEAIIHAITTKFEDIKP